MGKTRIWLAGKLAYSRYTPTCVGKTKYRDSPIEADIMVHPHVCGENFKSACFFSALVKVHPHVCGENLFPVFFDTIFSKVHPHVCGENIADMVAKTKVTEVHPHVCGENYILITIKIP